MAYKKQHPVELALAVLKCVQQSLQLKKLLEIGYNRISFRKKAQQQWPVSSRRHDQIAQLY